MFAYRGATTSFAVALSWVVGASCGGGPVSEHVTLDGSVDSLRAAFLADSGKVRAIFLASPT